MDGPVPTWPDEGPVIEWSGRIGGDPVYRKPTVTHIAPAGVTVERRDVEVRFALSRDGELRLYEGSVPQDELFRWLWPRLTEIRF